MPQPLGGPGLGLPLPTNLYPSYLQNAPIDSPNNVLSLAGGEAIPLPAGNLYVDIGAYSFLQFVDPVTQTWRIHNSLRGGLIFVKSDGFNARIANLTGCPIGAIVIAGGSNYVQSSTTITPSTGNSTWQPIVGGMLSVVSVAAAGGGYGLPPLVMIPAPPAPGVPATAFAAISSGTVSGVTLTNVGAGYNANPTVVLVPNPADPNINSGITQASVVINLNTSTTLASAISAVLCTNPGAPTTTLPTLTITGAGSGASVNAVTCSTLLTATVSAGAGYRNPSELQTFGALPTGTPAYTNPAVQFTAARARKASAAVTAGATTTTIGTIYDGGLFFGTPSTAILGDGVITTAAGITITTGTTTDTVLIQSAP